MSRVHSLQLDERHSGVCAVDMSCSTESGEGNESRKLRHKQFLSRFRPILCLMKASGEYYGNVSLDQDIDVGSSVFSRFYCAMVLLGQWVIFSQAAISLFFEGFSQMKTFYFLLLFTIWHLQCAALNTVCLYVLPKRQKKTSRLGQFVNNLVSVTPWLEEMKMHGIKLAIAFTCAFGICNTTFIVILDCYRHSSVARFRPWNGLFVFRLIHFVFGAFDSFAWSLPFTLFYASCQLLVRIFENLEKKISTMSPGIFTIEKLRMEHHKLCETVALADKVFSPLLLTAVIFDVPLICINFHQLVNSPLSADENIIFLSSVLYWGTAVVTRLAFVVRSAVKVNEKIHGFYDTLQNISVVDCQEHLELLRFLMHLRGDPIGLSVGGLAVIDKSFALSLVGIIISYFAVLVTLPS